MLKEHTRVMKSKCEVSMEGKKEDKEKASRGELLF